jgi:vacuolar-type H+-ATPase subunit H
MKKFSLFLISLFSMIKSVSAADFYDFYKLNINFGFIRDVEAWVFVITWAILFLLVNGIAKKIHLFKDDIKSAAIFSVLVSIAAMIGSPVSTWMMATIIISPLIIFFLFFIILVWTAISYFLLGGAKASETWERATSKFRMQKRASKQIKKLGKGVLSLFGKIYDGLNHIVSNKDEAYDSEAGEVIGNINASNREIDNLRVRADEEDPEGNSKAGDHFRKAIDNNEDAIGEVQSGDVKSAKKSIRAAEKEVKRGMKKARGLIKEAKHDFLSAGKQLREDEQHYVEEDVKNIESKASEIVSQYKSDYNKMLSYLNDGKYTQDQAKEWQERAYNGFKGDLSSINYPSEQIDSLWEKEIWSQGKISDRYAQIVDEINSKFSGKIPKKGTSEYDEWKSLYDEASKLRGDMSEFRNQDKQDNSKEIEQIVHDTVFYVKKFVREHSENAYDLDELKKKITDEYQNFLNRLEKKYDISKEEGEKLWVQNIATYYQDIESF